VSKIEHSAAEAYQPVIMLAGKMSLPCVRNSVKKPQWGKAPYGFGALLRRLQYQLTLRFRRSAIDLSQVL
jgi:hypothetical protein